MISLDGCGHHIIYCHAIVSVVYYMYLLCTGVVCLYIVYARKRYM